MLHKTYNHLFNKIFAYVALFMLILTTHAQAAGIIPCDGADCTLNSVMALVNNIMDLFFHVLLVPIFVLSLMYLGYGYLTAGGNPAQHAKLKNTMKHLFMGLLLMLCAWLIVKTILSVLGYTDTFGFFG